MTDIKKTYYEEVKAIYNIADRFLDSAQPWRGEYLRNMAHRADEAFSAEKKKAAELIILKCGEVIDKWNVETVKHRRENQSSDKSSAKGIIGDSITEYLEAQKEHYSNISKTGRDFFNLFKVAQQEDKQGSDNHTEIWEKYRRWSEMETNAWDQLCAESLSRIRFSQNLDFSEHLSDSWGPYNTKFNIITALERLKNIDPEWLESYLILYDSLK